MHREASIEINASPEAVYDLVSDLPRMGEWSPENIGGEWQGGRGKVDDHFLGHNRPGGSEGCNSGQVVLRQKLPGVRSESHMTTTFRRTAERRNNRVWETF
jgi:hypothetical protein